MSDEEDFVTIAELDDPMRIEMLVDVLAQHDIPAQTPGLNHRAMLGLQGAYISVRLKVPRAHESEARELVRAFSDASAEPPTDVTAGEPPRPELAASADERAKPSGPTKLRRIVAFCALSMTFGTGHFYAGEHFTEAVRRRIDRPGAPRRVGRRSCGRGQGSVPRCRQSAAVGLEPAGPHGPPVRRHVAGARHQAAAARAA
jgi:hypothetical protein